MKTYLQIMVEKQITPSLNRTVFPKNLRNKEQKENTVVFAYILLFSLFLLRIIELVKGGTQHE